MKTFKLLLLSAFFVMTSCTSDPCLDVTCFNDGVCDDGTCLCVDWYEGADCSTEERSKYYGEYTGDLFKSNQSSGSTITYQGTTFSITAGTDITRLFSGDLPLVLNNSGSSSFTIPPTQLTDNAGTFSTWEGTGYFTEDGISITGTQTYSTATYSFTFNGIK